MAREKASGSKGRAQGRASSRERSREKKASGAKSRTDKRAKSNGYTSEEYSSKKKGTSKGAPWGSMSGAKKKSPKLNPDKLDAAKARAKKNADVARMAEEFAYAVRAAGMFGASASETAAELEAMAAKAKAQQIEENKGESTANLSAIPTELHTDIQQDTVSQPLAPEETEQANTTAEAEQAPTVTFQELGLNNFITKAISEMGFEKPTPVQARIIPTLLSEEGDVVCLAQTGTGKTAAFGLPSLERIVAHNMERYTQVLVLSPTRELCKQITQDLRNYSKYLNDLAVVDVYGGAGIEPQIKALKKIPHIVVATPGRLLDLIGRKAVDLSRVHTLILDEADEMLNMGFKEELDAILESLPQEKRVLLFSATLPLEVEKIAKTYMRDAQVVTVGQRNSGSNNVKHYYYTIHEKDRYLALKRIVDYYPDIYGIIFCRTRRECGDIATALIKDGYDADALHGDLSQMQRDQVMRRFKEKNLKLLVATDVAARGIDVNNLTHVINYNLPDEVEQYTHRSGRTGRADKTGKSIVIINTKEQSKIRRIEKIINKTFAQSKLPTGEEVCSKQLLAMIDQINAVEVREEEIAPYLSLIEDKWRNLGRHEIIKKFLSMEFNRFLDYYRNAQDLNIVVEKKKKKGAEGQESETPDYVPRRNEKGFKWVKMNIGSKQSVSARTIVRMMTSLGVGKKGIGKIEIRRSECFVSISSNAAKYVVDQTNNSDYKGRRLWTELIEM